MLYSSQAHKNLLTNTERLSKAAHKEYADTIANIFVAANSDFIRRLKEEEPAMCKAVEELFAEEHRQELAEKDAIISQKDAQISKKDAQIEKLKKKIAQLQAQSASL